MSTSRLTPPYLSAKMSLQVGPPRLLRARHELPHRAWMRYLNLANPSLRAPGSTRARHPVSRLVILSNPGSDQSSRRGGKLQKRIVRAVFLLVIRQMLNKLGDNIRTRIAHGPSPGKEAPQAENLLHALPSTMKYQDARSVPGSPCSAEETFRTTPLTKPFRDRRLRPSPASLFRLAHIGDSASSSPGPRPFGGALLAQSSSAFAGASLLPLH